MRHQERQQNLPISAWYHLQRCIPALRTAISLINFQEAWENGFRSSIVRWCRGHLKRRFPSMAISWESWPIYSEFNNNGFVAVQKTTSNPWYLSCIYYSMSVKQCKTHKMQRVEGQRTFNFHGTGPMFLKKTLQGTLFKVIPPDVETRSYVSYTYGSYIQMS